MAAGSPRLLVTLQVGESTMGLVRFSPGQPVSPITVGREGNWRINAPGVAHSHLSLLFDGNQLFVAVLGPDLQASLNGTPVDGRWWLVQPPAELRFGHACLRIAIEAVSTRPSTSPSYPEAQFAATEASRGSAGHAVTEASQGAVGHTALDGAGQWERHNRSDPPWTGKKTQLYDPAAIAAAPAPVVRMAPAPTPAQPRPEQLRPVQAIVEEPPMVSTMRRPFGQGSDAPAPNAPMNLPSAVAPPAYPAAVAANVPLRTAPPVNVAYAAPPQVNVVPDPHRAAAALEGTAYAPLGNPALAPGRLGVPLDPASDPNAEPNEPPAKKSGAIAQAWRSASLVKKITFLLLPLAFAAVLWPEPPPRKRPAAAARALSSAPATSGNVTAITPARASAGANPGPASSSVLAADGGPSATKSDVAIAATGIDAGPSPGESLPVSPPSDAPHAPKAATNDSNERAAIEAAFGGRWQDAAQLYDRLAAAHPDEPAFREAARILRETKTHAK